MNYVKAMVQKQNYLGESDSGHRNGCTNANGFYCLARGAGGVYSHYKLGSTCCNRRRANKRG